MVPAWLMAIRHRPRWEAVLKELKKAGLARVGRGRVRPTPRGFLVAHRLPLWFAD